MKTKVDQINDAFIEVLSKNNSKQYEKYIREINRELINNVDSLTPDKVKSIIQGAKINIDDIALLFVMQNAILLIVSKKVPRKKLDKSLLPILVILGMYSLKRPKRFVEKLVKINKGIGLNANEKKAQEIIQVFKQDNEKVLKDARKIARKQLDTSVLKSKTSKRMVRDLNEGVKEKKSIKQIKNELVRKYNKLSNVERTLDTELHAQSEFVRKEHSKALGLTHKTWKTQGDSRVRHTKFHDGVANKRIPIDSDFRAGGLRATHPGDAQLPPSDRIRCRCYLTFE
jgi:hypothetical protein